jgi:hypothetical protein
MNKLLRHAGLLASAAFVLTAGGSALAGEPARKDGEPKVERKVVVIKDGVVVSGKDDGRPMAFGRHMDPEHRADHLRDMLQLRPDQEPALKAFLAATQPDIRKFETKLDKDGKPAEALSGPPKMLTTPERLDMQAKRMAEHQAAFQKRSAATRAFYGQLSPSQQKVFDTLHARHGGGRHVKIFRRGGPGPDRMMLRHGGPEGGPPMPGGMAWSDMDGEDFAMLEGGDIDVQVIVDDEDVGSGDED